MLATGRDRAPRLPDIVQIESTNLCNAKCVFCPRDEMHRRQGVMDFDLYRKIVDECAALGITHVRVHNYGEPFLDKQLVEKVRYAKSRGIAEVGMISNGSLITEELARGMIEAGLDAINISVDAAGKEVFESTRLHLDYDTVIDNIRTLARLRGEMGRRRPRLILSFVRQNNSADEQAFIDEWSQVADKIHITDLHNWAGTLQRPIRRAVPVLPALADVHRALGRARVALLRRLRRPERAGRPAHVDDRSRSGTPRPTAPCGASTSRAADRKSADRAICRRRTRRSGSGGWSSDGPNQGGQALCGLSSSA